MLGESEESTHCLKSRKNRERKSGDLNGTAHNVGDNEHEHAQLREYQNPSCWNHFSPPAKQSYLPSSTLVGRSAYIVGVLFVFENMRLALEGQSDSLETGRDQPDQHPDLFAD